MIRQEKKYGGNQHIGADIIPFPKKTTKNTSSITQDKSAEVILFLGIRYERLIDKEEQSRAGIELHKSRKKRQSHST